MTRVVAGEDERVERRRLQGDAGVRVRCAERGHMARTGREGVRGADAYG